jgi:ABC-type transport system involved in multi-copper enzyme maturation permease subunit
LGAQGLTRIRAVAANTFRESVRERVLYNLLFFAILMTLCGLLLGELSIRQDEKIVKDIGLASIDIFGTLIAIFIGVGLISKEIERKSLYPLLAKPISRGEFLLGKFLGLSFTLLVNVAAMTAGLYLTLAATRKAPDPRLLVAIYASYLGLMLAVAIALFFSSVASSSTVAALCTVALVVSGRFSDVIHNMRDVASAPAWLVEGLYYALPNFHNFDLKNRAVYGDPIAAGDLVWISVYATVYIAVLLGAANLSFASRDLQ